MPQAFYLKQPKVQYNLAIFFLLVPSERTMHCATETRNRKTKIPQSPSTSPYLPGSAGLKYACIPRTTKIRSKVLPRNVSACLCKSSELMMLPPTIDSTASTWFQIWVAALSPIALVSFVFHAAGFVEIDDCRFNPVSQPSPDLGDLKLGRALSYSCEIRRS